MKKALITLVVVLLLLISPMAGIMFKGYPLHEYLRFPPMSVDLDPSHAPQSMVAFFVMLIAIVCVISPFIYKVIVSQNSVSAKNKYYNFPSWGWLGIIILLLAWILAWSRFSWFEQWQTHTFSPLWIGYIIIVNAWTYVRSGKSLISDHPKLVIILLIFSSVFWWYFEYLNVYVENWYYVNVEDLSKSEFFWYATLPFATVLPAVWSTKNLLQTFVGFSAGLHHFFSLRIPSRKGFAFMMMLASTAGLVLMARYTDYLFFMIWLAPLIIIISSLILLDKPTIFSGVAHADWTQPYLWGMAALICGFFWEMWNYFSYTRWEYAIPFVEKIYVFEMPLPGYAGYLPFGILCGTICLLIAEFVPVKNQKSSM